MTYPFAPLGGSAVVAYADDSTDTSITIAAGSAGTPNALLVVNPDAANVVAVSVSFDSLDTNAVVPLSGFNGVGTVVGPASSVLLAIPTAQYQTGSLYVSAAGVSGTGNVYVTPGVI